MQRRDLLGGAAALAVFGIGGAVATGRIDLPGATAPSGASEDEQGAEDGIEPIQLTGIDAPGSDPGPISVPEPGTPTVVKLFATWCPSCQRMMDYLPTVYEDYREAVQFVSVTNEPVGNTVSEDEVVEWWEDHDGRWQLAHDPDLELTQALDARGVPFSALLDEDNTLVWSDLGYKSEQEFRSVLDRELDTRS